MTVMYIHWGYVKLVGAESNVYIWTLEKKRQKSQPLVHGGLKLPTKLSGQINPSDLYFSKSTSLAKVNHGALTCYNTKIP